MKRKEKLIFILFLSLLLFTNIFITSKTYCQEGECVLCPQFVPDCGSDEILIPQTCTECAYCKAIETKKVKKENLLSRFLKKLKLKK